MAKEGGRKLASWLPSCVAALAMDGGAGNQKAAGGWIGVEELIGLAQGDVGQALDFERIARIENLFKGLELRHEGGD